MLISLCFSLLKEKWPVCVCVCVCRERRETRFSLVLLSHSLEVTSDGTADHTQPIVLYLITHTHRVTHTDSHTESHTHTHKHTNTHAHTHTHTHNSFPHPSFPLSLFLSLAHLFSLPAFAPLSLLCSIEAVRALLKADVIDMVALRAFCHEGKHTPTLTLPWAPLLELAAPANHAPPSTATLLQACRTSPGSAPSAGR